jgi:hypothetical protein
MAGGGAERLASDAKPRRLAGGAGEAAAADRARSGQSWGAEMGGGVAKLAQSAKLPKRVALPAGTEVHRNAGAECRGAKLAGAAQNWRRHEVGALGEAALKASHLSELRKTDDQGLIDWCPPVMRDTHPKD